MTILLGNFLLRFPGAELLNVVEKFCHSEVLSLSARLILSSAELFIEREFLQFLVNIFDPH